MAAAHPHRVAGGAIRVAQQDLRSVRVEVGPVRLLLRYGFVFDGHERVPESVAVAGTEVTAFFLSSTVRDRITATPSGFRVERTWSVLQSGRLRLVLTVDVPEAVEGARTKGGRPTPPRTFRYLFPGVAAGARVGELRMFRGERTAVPACVLLAAEDLGVCVFAETPAGGAGLSVGIHRSSDEGGGLVRVQFETPARESRPPNTGHGAGFEPGDGTEEEAECEGRFERELRVHVVVGKPSTVYETAFAEVLDQEADRNEPAKWALREEVRSFLETHLVLDGGVCGLRVVPGADILSASAGTELAVLLARLYPADVEMIEWALRLADFALRGQHPAGLFYERYHLRERSWVGLRGVVPGRPGRPPLVSVEESSRVACSLLDLGDALDGLHIAGERYLLAARRMVDAFLDSRGRFQAPDAVMAPDLSLGAEGGLGALRFLHPLLRIVDRDTRERYRKAAAFLVARWIEIPAEPLELPSSRGGREPDSKATVLVLEAALEATARRIKVPRSALLPAMLLPWLRLGGGPERGPLPGAGALADCLERPRWKPRPAQITYLSRRFAALAKGRSRELLENIARSAAGAAGSLPLGCSYVARDAWGGLAGVSPRRARSRGRATAVAATGFTVGPVDARDFVTELGYCVRLEEEGLW